MRSVCSGPKDTAKQGLCQNDGDCACSEELSQLVGMIIFVVFELTKQPLDGSVLWDGYFQRCSSPLMPQGEDPPESTNKLGNHYFLNFCPIRLH